MTAPVVSVCVPVHRPRAEHLSDLIESVLTQTLAEVELVISDDGTGDDAARAPIRAAALSDARVRVVRGVAGMVENWNCAVGHATGTFVVVPGQDDRFALDTLRTLADFALHRQLDLALAEERYIDGSGRERSNPSRALRPEDVLADGDVVLAREDVLRLALLRGNVFGDPCAALVRREALLAVGPFSPTYRHAADLEMWMRIAAHGGRVGRTTRTAAYRRLHGENVTREHVATGTAAADRLRLHLEYHSEIDHAAAARSLVRLRLHQVVDAARTGRPRAAAKALPKHRSVGLALSAWSSELLELARVSRPQRFA